VIRFLALAALVLASAGLRAQEEARVRAPLLLNGQTAGEIWVYPQPKPQVDASELAKTLEAWISLETRRQLELLTPSAQGRLELTALASLKMQARFDEESLSLFFELPPSQLKSRSQNVVEQSYDPQTGAQIYASAPWSGFVNLRASTGISSEAGDWGRDPFAAEMDWIHAFGALRLVNRWDARSDRPQELRRRESYAFYDWDESALRLSVGDLYPRTRSFQRTRSLLGAQLGRETQLQRWWQSQNTGSREILLDGPSTVEVWVNGSLRLRFDAPAGPLRLDEIPLYSGRNDVQVRIRDRFGKEEILSEELLHEQSLIKRGHTDFSLSVGADAPLFDDGHDYDWRRGFASGYLRYGLLSTVELGVNAQRSTDATQAGLEARWMTAAGLWDLSLSGSDTRAQGAAGAVLAAWDSQRILGNLPAEPVLRLLVEAQGRDFRSPLAPGTLEPLRLRTLESLSLRGPDRLQHVLSHQASDAYDLPVQHVGRYDLHWSLGRSWSLGAAFETQWGALDQRAVYLSLNWLEPSLDLSSSASFRSQDKAARIEIEHNPDHPIGNFLQRAALERSDTSSAASLEAEYAGSRGIAGAQYRHEWSGGRGDGQVGAYAALSVAYTPNAVGLGQPIFDSFALFSPETPLESGEALQIASSGSEAEARMDGWGAGVLSRLSSQASRTLEIVDARPGGLRTAQPELLRLDSAYLCGIEVRVAHSLPLRLKARLTSEGKSLALASGTWTLLNAKGEAIAEGLAFTNWEGGLFVEAPVRGHSLRLRLERPADLVAHIELRALGESSGESIDLGDLAVTPLQEHSL
jgi:outer membrane usher protein